MESCVFPMSSDTGEFYVTPLVKAAFDKHGYILVRNLFTLDEVAKVKSYMEANSEIQNKAYGRSDGKGRRTKVSLWNRAVDDIGGVVARCQKVAGTMQALLGGEEIYHYHSKLMMKEPHTGGAHIWHQDYGYWYNNGCLFPDMGSVFMPVDKCTKINSCLQVLDSSHKMGRINHILEGDQAGADPERMKEALKAFPLVYVEMEPGDALFFHCNLLHSSDQNNSDMRRWVMISSFNQKRNNPVIEHHHPFYHPLNILPNSAIMECQKMTSDMEKDFMNPAQDTSAQKNKN